MGLAIIIPRCVYARIQIGRSRFKGTIYQVFPGVVPDWIMDIGSVGGVAGEYIPDKSSIHALCGPITDIRFSYGYRIEKLEKIERFYLIQGYEQKKRDLLDEVDRKIVFFFTQTQLLFSSFLLEL